MEDQVLRLLNRESVVAEEKKALVDENNMLKELLHQHNIVIPTQPPNPSPAAKLSVLDAPGGAHALRVVMPEASPEPFIPASISTPESIDVDVQPHFDQNPSQVQPPPPFSAIPSQPSPLPNILVPQVTESQPLPSSQKDVNENGFRTPQPRAHDSPIPHPSGLDVPQVGIDFVLALESPCLDHARADLESETSYGHSMSFQAPLLTHGPRPLRNSSAWTMPAAEIERLLSLSTQLNLAGELTPVQAWSRIKSHPAFEKMNINHLEYLREALIREVQCYG